MGVHQREMVVHMCVTITHGDHVVVRVTMVFVVVMLVGVGRRVVMVRMLMVRSGHSTNTDCSEHYCDDLDDAHRFTEREPRNPDANKRRSGEDELAACRAEVAGTTDPQRDRDAIADRTQAERRDDHSDARQSTANDHADEQVAGARNNPFRKRDR